METNRSRRLPLLLLLLAACSLLVACMSTGPDPADVSADRDRWTAFRDATADGVIDATEGPLVSTLLVEWDRKLAADEGAAAKPRDELADLLRVYGAAAVQVFLVPELQSRAPELFRLADRNSDGALDEQELLSIDPTSPVFALVVASTAARLLKKR